MMKKINIFFQVFLVQIIISVISPQPLIAQDGIYNEAVGLFEKGYYIDAIPKFETLLKNYRKEPTYHYYLGVCYVHENIKLEQAKALLKYAGAKAKFSDTYFYLGLAQLRTYNFREARLAFEKFKIFATKTDIKEHDPDLYLKYVDAGEKQTQSLTSIKFISKSDKEESIPDYINPLLTEGEIIPLPSAYKSTLWGTSKEDELAFKLNSGIYYAAFNMRTRSYDLFEGNLIQENSTLISENLSSELNENYIWFDSDNNTIYFASQGFNSMGGYDIFKSSYNSSSKSWSKPENLGFPINSAYDDIYFLKTKDNNFVLISNRENNKKTYTIYKVAYASSSSNIANASSETLLSHSLFNKSNPSQIAASHHSIESKPSTSKPKPNGQYEQILFQALNYQLTADSFLRSAEKKKRQVKDPAYQNQKPTLYSQIKSDEENWKMNQTKADNNYAELQKMELDANPAPVSKPVSTNKAVISMGIQNNNNLLVSNKVTSKPQSEFKILSEPEYKSSGEIPTNEKLPDHLIYKIQLGVFSKPAEPGRFGGLSPISADFLADRNLTKYYCGKFISYTDAQQALPKVKSQGFKDAYIVSYFDGKKIPVSRAVDIEKQ